MKKIIGLILAIVFGAYLMLGVFDAIKERAVGHMQMFVLQPDMNQERDKLVIERLAAQKKAVEEAAATLGSLVVMANKQYELKYPKPKVETE